MKQKQKGAIPLAIIVAVLALLALGGGATYFNIGPAKQLKEKIFTPQILVTGIPQREGGPSRLSTPTPAADEFAGWQEYNNEKYHYKIKYPADWYFIKEGYSPPPPASIKLSSISDPYPSVGIDYMSVGIDVDKALGRTLDNYEEIASLKSQYYQETKLSVGNEPAAKIAVPDPNSSEPISVYIQHKNYIYRIVWGDNTDQFVQNRKLFEKILQSFAFTDN